MYAVVGKVMISGRSAVKVLNTKSHTVSIIFEDDFKDFEESLGENEKVINATYSKEEKKVVATQGSFDRFKYPATLVILNEYIDLDGNTLGYLSANALGELIVADVEKTLRIGKLVGIQNGAIVCRNNKTFIRCLEGRYKVVCKNPGVLVEKIKQCRVQSIASAVRTEKMLNKIYSGDLLKIKIGD